MLSSSLAMRRPRGKAIWPTSGKGATPCEHALALDHEGLGCKCCKLLGRVGQRRAADALGDGHRWLENIDAHNAGEAHERHGARRRGSVHEVRGWDPQ